MISPFIPKPSILMLKYINFQFSHQSIIYVPVSMIVKTSYLPQIVDDDHNHLSLG